MIGLENIDFNFFEKKVEELLNDAISAAALAVDEMNKNKDKISRGPVDKIKTAIIALSKGDSKIFETYFDDFTKSINTCDQKYRDYYLLVFGSLNEINRFVGKYGSFDSIISYPVLTTAAEEREITLRQKDGNKIESLSDFQNIDEIKSAVKKSVFKVAVKVMKNGLGSKI